MNVDEIKQITEQEIKYKLSHLVGNIAVLDYRLPNTHINRISFKNKGNDKDDKGDETKQQQDVVEYNLLSLFVDVKYIVTNGSYIIRHGISSLSIIDNIMRNIISHLFITKCDFACNNSNTGIIKLSHIHNGTPACIDDTKNFINVINKVYGKINDFLSDDMFAMFIYNLLQDHYDVAVEFVIRYNNTYTHKVAYISVDIYVIDIVSGNNSVNNNVNDVENG